MRTLPPDAVNVRVLNADTLLTLFADGQSRIFDLTPLKSRKCYARLNDPAFVAKATVQHGCVTWPDEIDIDPDWLYEDSVPAPTWADAARAYFRHHHVFRYRLKAVSDMTDDEVVRKCHWWQEEHHMADDYWSFVKENYPHLGLAR